MHSVSPVAILTTGSEGTVWVWTRVFCYVAILLAILCAILYAVRSIYALKAVIRRQKNQNNTESPEPAYEQSTNRKSFEQLPSDAQRLSRMLPGGQDSAGTELVSFRPYPSISGGQS
uniref:DAG1 domain-containing protein n=1 Tax=Globodera pallida TaxID=36090 RepID=A0A183C8K9_GLOPA